MKTACTVLGSLGELTLTPSNPPRIIVLFIGPASLEIGLNRIQTTRAISCK